MKTRTGYQINDQINGVGLKHSSYLSVSLSSLSRLQWTKRYEKGQAVVFFVISLAVLLAAMAMALDYGLATMRANDLQRACDAAALSAAGEYSERINAGDSDTTAKSKAAQDAVNMANSNGVTITTGDVTQSGAYNTTTPYTVRVSASDSVNTLFGKLLNVSYSNISRHATAQLSPVTGATGGTPLAITHQQYTASRGGSSVDLELERVQKSDFDEYGEVIGVDIGNGSSKSMGNWASELSSGSSDTASVGNNIATSLNASKTSQGNKLVSSLSPRIGDNMTMMITDPQPQHNGTTNPPLHGLVTVQLTDAYKHGSSAHIEILIPDIGFVSPDQAVSISTTPPTYGNTYIVRVIDDL